MSGCSPLMRRYCCIMGVWSSAFSIAGRILGVRAPLEGEGEDDFRVRVAAGVESGLGAIRVGLVHGADADVRVAAKLEVGAGAPAVRVEVVDPGDEGAAIERADVRLDAGHLVEDVVRRESELGERRTAAAPGFESPADGQAVDDVVAHAGAEDGVVVAE